MLNYVNKYKNNFNELLCIGKGGFGSVYKIYHRFEKKFYAIKKIYLTDQILHNNFDIFKEVQLFSNLEHPNIVRYHSSWVDIDTIDFDANDFSETSDSSEDIPNQICKINSPLVSVLYIQMELCDHTLKEYMMSYMLNESLEMRINYIQQLVSGLSYLHNQNIIHRDLKPDNIFVCIKNEIVTLKIGDFGLSTIVKNKKITFDNSFLSIDVGTGMYRAPEIDEGLYDSSIDIYSLGIIIIELLLNCKTTFEKYKILNNIIKNKVFSNYLISSLYDDIITRMITTDPLQRPTITEISCSF
jgi:translation initiation factor 2-alpha kinase 4